LKNTLYSAGKACLYVASAVAIGYGVLALSFGFKVHQWLALLIACAMLVSVFASLTLIPAFLQRFQPKFLNR
jgi:predicted RND superfamily exporter protein